MQMLHNFLPLRGETLMTFHIISLSITFFCLVYGILLNVYHYLLAGITFLGIGSIIVVLNMVVYIRVTTQVNNHTSEDDDTESIDPISRSTEYDIL